MMNLKFHEVGVSNSYIKPKKIINVVKEANKAINTILKNFPKRLSRYFRKIKAIILAILKTNY